MQDKLIKVLNAEKNFGEIKAVDNVSFSVKKGSIFGLLGPNGAGKTTIIRMIMNILAADNGRILINEDRIGYLPEERGLYKKLIVCEMLTYLGNLKNIKGKELDKSIDYWLSIFNLIQWKNKKIDDLSKGMSQKVQFTGAVVHNPEILILDEPFAGLDPVSADMLNGIILKLNKKRKNRSILYTYHGSCGKNMQRYISN